MNKWRKMKLSAKAFKQRCWLFFTLPTAWLLIILFIAAVVCFIMSKSLYEHCNHFASSMFSNVFAGLVTGIAISLLAGMKAVYFAFLEGRYKWLEDTHRMILDFINIHRELITAHELSDEEYDVKAYDTGSYANWVNDRIMQGTYDRTKWIDPPKYFLKKYNYDCMVMNKTLYDFRDYLFSISGDCTKRKECLKELEPIKSAMMSLNSMILDDMRLIEVKIASAKKAII